MPNIKLDVEASTKASAAFEEEERARRRDSRPSKALGIAHNGRWKMLDHQGGDISAEMEAVRIELYGDRKSVV